MSAATGDLDEILATVAKVGRDRIAPVARRLDEGEWIDSVWDDLCALGVPGLCIPEEYGGLGAPYSAYLAVTAELARWSAVAGLIPALNVLVSRALIAHAAGAVAARYVPRLAEGSWKACWCFTEAETGSDPKAITTRAEPTEDGRWLLSGEKVFISHSSHADIAVVFATLDSRLTAFVGPTAQGFMAGPREPLMGFAGADTGQVSFDRMPVSDVVGQFGQGFSVLVAGEAEAKLRASAICQGIARNALGQAVAYARARTHRGQPIGEKFQTIQWLLAECGARVEAIDALVERGGRLVDSGAATGSSAAKIKLMVSRLTREVVSDAMQVHGAYGFSRHFDIEMLYRQAKMYELVQGVSEINRIIIARDLLAP
jgi:alkylation response protein AidB-like acyl-CoA dehydrogenase